MPHFCSEAIPNTLSLQSYAQRIIALEDLRELSVIWRQKQAFFILGEGSNSLFPPYVQANAIRLPQGKPFVFQSNSDHIGIHAPAGFSWNRLVHWCLEQAAFGLENLAGIPGTVGAAPIQNIGAYGVEACDYIAYVDCFDWRDGTLKRLSPTSCQFSYRNSLFKIQKKLIVTGVGFQLHRNPSLNLSYPRLRNLDPMPEDPIALAQAVVALRQTYLPDFRKLPNVGSFFMNPILSLAQFKHLGGKERFPIHFSSADSQSVKIPVAWLLEQSGFKGRFNANGRVRMHPEHALILTNQGGASLCDVLALARDIQQNIRTIFGINLNIEPQTPYLLYH